jgi:MFS family permease
MAILTVGHSSGMLLGSLLGGVLMDWFDLRWAFPIGAVLMLGCLAVFYGAGARPGRAAKARDPGAN